MPLNDRGRRSGRLTHAPHITAVSVLLPSLRVGANLACALTAWRAATVDPAVCLRAE